MPSWCKRLRSFCPTKEYRGGLGHDWVDASGGLAGGALRLAVATRPWTRIVRAMQERTGTKYPTFETCEFEEAIAEEAFRKLEAAILRFMNETEFKRFVMILRSAGFANFA